MLLFVLFFIEIVTGQWTITRGTQVTPSLYERVELLKRQINKQIYDRQHEQRTIRLSIAKDQFEEEKRLQRLIPPISNKEAIATDYEYVNMEIVPITPIMDYDERKKKSRFRLRKVKTKTNRGPNAPAKAGANSKANGEPAGVLRSNVAKFKSNDNRTADATKKKDDEIFYRRYTDDRTRNTPSEWTHCQCLISPFLNGFKTDISEMRRISVNENVVSRLVQMLTENTSKYTKEEVYSIMYQISNMQLRFFDWDVSAVEILLNALAGDRMHSFRTIKRGLKKIFEGWRLDISNTTNLLKQSRIFRPPCVRVSDQSGSTKTSQFIRFYTKTTSKKCADAEADDDEC